MMISDLPVGVGQGRYSLYRTKPSGVRDSLSREYGARRQYRARRSRPALSLGSTVLAACSENPLMRQHKGLSGGGKAVV